MAVAIYAARGTRAAEDGEQMMEPVAASEIQKCPSFEHQLAETRRKKVVRFLAKQIKAGLSVIAVGEHGERQFAFAELIERLPTEADRVALIRMHSARTAAPVAAPATTPAVAATISAEELAALEENWESANDKSRARSEKHLSYVREVCEITGNFETCTDRELHRACKEVAERNLVGWFTINRACMKVKGRPAELWAFLLLDKNRGRSRHEYGRDWDRYFRSYYLARTAPAASVCRDLACKGIVKMDVDAARRAGIRVPTAKALLDRLHSELSEEAILLARCGADAVAARHYQQRDYSSLCAGEGLSGDGHKFNFWVEWPDGYKGRPVIFAFQCLYTNAVTGWHVDRTENQDLVRLAASDAFRKCLPHIIFIDNGRAGASKWLTGGVGPGRRFRFQVRVEDAIGVFRLLGIDIRFTEPYAGRSKKIERFWGDLESRIRARAEFRRAYTGNGKDEPAENFADHAVPLELFIRVVAEEIAGYNARGHDTPILKGASCNEVWTRSVASAGAVLRKATESQLRLLLLAAQKVRVHAKDSCIHMFGNRYEVTEDTAAVENGRRIVSGADVVVRFHPERLHDDLPLYDREGHFLGEAKCVSPTGFADHAAARETARLNKVRKRHLRAELEAQDLIDRIALGGTLPQKIESPSPAAARVVRPFRSPIEAPRATEREVFDSSLDIYDDDQKQVG